MKKELFINKSDCCGCEACASICPMNLISMKADEEGFLYPYLTDENRCIECNKCEKVCPIKNNPSLRIFDEHTYTGYLENTEDLKISSSGGFATALSRSFLKFGDYVFGVKYSNDFREIYYKKTSSVEELETFRGSKYVQAKKGNIFNELKQDLNAGKKILFIGLPCEISAIKLFCGDHINLFTCALICHGPTSQAVHRQYCDLITMENENINFFSVRYKKDGWKPYYIYTKFSSEREKMELFENSVYGKAFRFMKRPSCNKCGIKRNHIKSDITIGDYHIGVNNKEPINNFGNSSIVIHTKKGEEIFSIVDGFYFHEVSNVALLNNKAYVSAIPEKKNRQEFGCVFVNEGIVAASNLKSCKRIDTLIMRKNVIRIKLSKIKQLIKHIVKKNNQ